MDVLHPLWLLLLVPLLGGVALWARREPRTLRRLLAASAALLLGLGSAGFAFRKTETGRKHVLVVDRSGSVLPFASRADLEKIVSRHARKFGKEDRIGLVLFGENAFVAQSLAPPRALENLDLGGYVVGKDATDIEAALSLASSLLPASGHGEILLISDGRENAGCASRGRWNALARGVRLHAAPVGGVPGGDFAVRSLEGPALVSPADPFTLVARVVSWSGGKASIAFRDGAGRLLAPPRTADFLPGETRAFRETLVPAGTGEPLYTVEVSPEVGRDPFPGNDRAETVVRVAGERRVLYVSSDPRGRIFGRLLERIGGLTCRKVKPFRLGPHPRLEGWDLVVLDGVSAEDLGEGRMEAIESFVRDAGGGLILLGGPAGFGLGGYFDTPVEAASPLRCDPEEKASLALVLLLDASGSMNREVARDRTKFHQAQAATGKLMEKLRPGDFLAVVPFSGAPLLDPCLKTVVGDEPPDAVGRALLGVEPSGSTSILNALSAARVLLEGREEERKHVLLFSDGVETVRADRRAYRALRRWWKANKVTVSAAVTAAALTPAVRDFFVEDIVHQGKIYRVDQFALLPRDFVEDVTRARGRLEKSGAFDPSPGRFPSDVSARETPAVAVFVRTGRKEKGALCAYTVGEKRRPLLAWWRYGLGRAVGFTSSLEEDWAPAWRKWGRPSGSATAEGLLAFWEAWIRWASGEAGNAAVRLVRAGGGLEIRVRLAGKGGARDGLALKAQLISRGASVAETSLQQVGPGLYGGTFDTPGREYVRAVVVREGGGPPVGEGGIFIGASKEMGVLGPNEDRLRALTGGGGTVWSDPALFTPGPGVPQRAGFEEVGWVLFAAAAFCFAAFTFTRPAGGRGKE